MKKEARITGSVQEFKDPELKTLLAIVPIAYQRMASMGNEVPTRHFGRVSRVDIK